MRAVQETQLSEAKRRVVDRLKRGGPATAVDLAADLGLTPTAVRQHLAGLEHNGLVVSAKQRSDGPGRPASVWDLTPLADELFPDRHADLTVGLIEATREALGEPGLGQVIDAHARAQIAGYRSQTPVEVTSVRGRVGELARQRSAEGYLADVVEEADSSFILVENHCPICDAARACPGLCRAELDVFRSVLGDDVDVERTQHLLSDDARCAYRITPRPREGH